MVLRTLRDQGATWRENLPRTRAAAMVFPHQEHLLQKFILLSCIAMVILSPIILFFRWKFKQILAYLLRLSSPAVILFHHEKTLKDRVTLPGSRVLVTIWVALRPLWQLQQVRTKQLPLHVEIWSHSFCRINFLPTSVYDLGT